MFTVFNVPLYTVTFMFSKSADWSYGTYTDLDCKMEAALLGQCHPRWFHQHINGHWNVQLENNCYVQCKYCSRGIILILARHLYQPSVDLFWTDTHRVQLNVSFLSVSPTTTVLWAGLNPGCWGCGKWFLIDELISDLSDCLDMGLYLFKLQLEIQL